MGEERRPPTAVTVRDDTLRSAIDALSEHAFLTLDADGIITAWSRGAERLFGYGRHEAIGAHLTAVFAPGSAVRPEDLRQAERQGSVSNDRWMTPAAGQRHCVRATVAAYRDSNGAMTYAALAHEVGAAKIDAGAGGSDDGTLLAQRFEERLSESNALLATEIADRTEAEAARARLLRRLVVAQEEERRRIARDLHDDLGQRLTALRLTLSAATETGVGSIGKALEMLGRIEQGLDFLAWELRPAALDELGLDKVLENYVHEWSRHAGVRATFHSELPNLERFAPELEATIYRIAQEALNNVAKHAHARMVNVVLEQRADSIVLAVEDDGVGFQPIVSEETMIGLTGMRERAAAIGGALEIEPTPGGGTTVLTRIPTSARAALRNARTASYADMAHGIGAAAEPSATVLSALRLRLQELQKAVASRDEFIATVAHELRNPVAPLTFQLRLAIERVEQTASAGDAVPAEWVKSQLRRLEQRLHRLLETLDRLLDVSRLSTGRIDLQPEPTDLAVAVREVVSTLEAELAVARCKLVITERGEATGIWDRLRIEQICRNLLSNAIRFGAGRPIEVLVSGDHEVAIMQVRDHGVGIEPEQQGRIFERFERGLEQRSGGFGIGLWVVKNICVAMGGTITVESALGEGARFTVRLPRRRNRETGDGDREGME